MDRKDYMRWYQDAHRDELKARREAERLVRIKANEHERRLLQMKAENDEDVRLARWDAHIQAKLHAMPPKSENVARHPDCDLKCAQNSIDATLFS